MSSSSRSRRYDVFPSFSGEDVRKSFLSHLLKELDRKLIITFIDHGIERSHQISTELLSAIRESRISIVVFSKKYASSTWCLNELLEIHKCYEELDQMVIPIFYGVDPSDVRKQTGSFGKAFEETCKGKSKDVTQRWMRVLTDVANIAGEDSRNWSDESDMIEKIATDVSNKLITPSACFGDFVGIEAHLDAINSILCLGSEEVKMVGILGPSGIGKSTIARALFSQLSSQFCHRAFVAYKRTSRNDYGMKLCWEQQFLSEILCQKDIKICHLGEVEQRLKHKKVLIVLDDVDDLELLKTLVGDTECFGSGSIIIVITKNRQLLKSHEIHHVYEVDFPSQDLALEMFCRNAFRQNYPPYSFIKLATKVVKLVGNLPLGITILGSSLKGMDHTKWMEMLPRLRNGINGKIENTLRVGYDGLDVKDQELFLYIACLFNGHEVNYINSLLGDGASIGLRTLANNSLIRITPPGKLVQMHNLLQKLGREIVRAESIHNPGKRRFLLDVEDIREVFTDNSGTEHILGIYFDTTKITEPLFIDEKSFEGMRNLQFLKIYNVWPRETRESIIYSPQGLLYFPRKLKQLHWYECPLKCMPSNFRAEYLVELKLKYSKLEKLWDGIQPLRSLKKIKLDGSMNLKEIPNLSNAINLEEMSLRRCTSLVTLPSSIRNLNKLLKLLMPDCTKLENLPGNINLESLECLDFTRCSQLRFFPQISRNISKLFIEETAIENEEDSLWVGNIHGLTELYWTDCPLRCMPWNFCPEYLVKLSMIDSKLEKLWEGVQSLGSLTVMNLSGSGNLTEIPDLSKGTNLKSLMLNYCGSLVTIPCSFRKLNKLEELFMRRCTRLELLPTGVNLMSLLRLDLGECSRLRSFPQISTNITELYLDHTAIEEVPFWIEDFYRIMQLTMRGCKELRRIHPNIAKLKCLEEVDFSECEGLTSMSACTAYDQLPVPEETPYPLTEILESDISCAILTGGEMPTYFTHQAYGSSLSITLPQSSVSQEFVGFKGCVMLEPPTDLEGYSSCTGVHWHFRGKDRVHHFRHRYNMEGHFIVFYCEFSPEEVNVPQSELSSNEMRFEFFTHDSISSTCNHFSSDQSCSQLNRGAVNQRIKRCGVRVWTVFPTPDSSGRSSETNYNQVEIDVETVRNKKPPQMTIANTALNLNLSLGMGGASAQLPCKSKLSSSSNSFANFHGDETLLHLSLSSSDPMYRRRES